MTRQTDFVGQRGERSRARQEEVVKAALEVLGEGPRRLAEKLGLTEAAVAERLGISPGTVNYHFGRREGGTLTPNLVEAVREQMGAEVRRNVDDYRKAAHDLRAGARVAGRALVRRVLLEDLADFRVDGKTTLSDRGRERLYYLMVALCDLEVNRTKVDYAAELNDSMSLSQELYAQVYEDFCEVSNREFITERERTQRAINAYLEGVEVHRRFGAAPDDDEIVDTVLRLFYITTKPSAGADLDIDGDLFGLPSVPETRSVGAHSTFHATREALYAEVSLAMEALTEDEVLMHCAMHRPLHEDRPPADRLPRRLYEAQRSHIARGGPVRRVVRYWRIQDLDADLSWIAELGQRESRALVETRALIAESPPVMATMVVGERLGAIARDDPLTARLIQGVTFTDAPGVRFCEGTFNAIANDPHSYLIAGPNGIQERGVQDARRRLLEYQS
jgi:AcrR family transcriptional regulator